MKKLKMLLIGNAKSILFRITNKWNYWCRKILIVPNIRKKLNNTSKINNSFLCNNCTGAMMMHDLGGRFDSPTVNLWMSPKDFIYLVKNIKELSKMDILEITPSKCDYPIGMLGEVKLHFLHYKSFREANECWIRRMKRLDVNNMSIIMVAEKLSKSEMESFINLKAKKKIVLIRSEVINNLFTFKINYPTNKKDFKITDYSDLIGHRYYDQFNFINFFTQIEQ